MMTYNEIHIAWRPGIGYSSCEAATPRTVPQCFPAMACYRQMGGSLFAHTCRDYAGQPRVWILF